ARIEIDTQPFAGKDYVGIGAVELLQPTPDRPRAIAEQFLPAGVERLQIDGAVDLLDQVVLAGKIPIQQRLRDTEPTCQRARAAGPPRGRPNQLPPPRRPRWLSQLTPCADRPATSVSVWRANALVRPSCSWARSHWNVVCAEKPSITAAGKQKRLSSIVGVGL